MARREEQRRNVTDRRVVRPWPQAVAYLRSGEERQRAMERLLSRRPL